MSALSTDAILQGMADALPTHPKGDEGSDLASSHEAIALLIHAYLVALGFKLRGFDEDKRLPECESLAPRLPPQWNAGPRSIGFWYAHKQSSMTFVIRVDRMGSKIEVRGLAVEDDKMHRFERAPRDVVKSEALPVRITLKEDGTEDRTDLVEKLRGVFKDRTEIDSILHDVKVNIVQRLIPKLQREGYVEEAEAEANARAERRAQEASGPRGAFPAQMPPNPAPYPRPDLLPQPARPAVPTGEFIPPGFEDPYDINRPPGAGGLFMPGRSPYNIGHDDLNPPGLGPHDPLRGFFTGGGLPRPGGGGGMHPTFDDPLFMGPGGGGDGQAGYDPQVPPGARFDPTGPGGGPRFPGGRRGGGPFGGDPFGGGHGGGFGGGGFV